MAEIRPFRGVHYNPDLVRDLSVAICPPYDIIPQELQEELYRRSPYNFIRVEYGKTSPGDNARENRYTRAAATLNQWLQKGVLLTDSEPAIYLDEHRFVYQEAEFVRRCLIATVRLEEPGSNVRPHEGTLAEPKSDRLSLMWACQANTSPVFALFQDDDSGIIPLLVKARNVRPDMVFSPRGGESHELWEITDRTALAEASRRFAGKSLYIADGHHRYESALTYRRERMMCTPSASADEPFNYVMMFLTDFADPGLLVLPPHRLVGSLPKVALRELRRELETMFDITEIPRSEDAWQKLDKLTSGSEAVATVLFGLEPDRFLVLRLRDQAAAAALMPTFHSELYRNLEVSVVDHVILAEMLGLNNELPGAVSYCYDRHDAVSRVQNGEFQLAFLLKPVTPSLIKTVADAGERMPKKSTYFFPKAPAGIVLHRLA